MTGSLEQAREAARRGRRLFGKAHRLVRNDERPIDRRDFYASLWEQTATAVGAELVTLPDGFLELRAGSRSMRTFYELLPIDDPVTLELAGHKSASAALLRDADVPTATQVVVRPGQLGPAMSLLADHEFVVVKPQASTSAGAGVVTHVANERQLRRAVSAAATYGAGWVVVESQVPGSVYRLLYLDGELLDAVLREPARVVGDGRRSIESLVRAENERRRRIGDRATGLVPTGLELETTLAAGGHSRRTVLSTGETVQVSGRSNTGDVADSRSVGRSMCPEIIAVCARAAATLGVRLAGIDLISTDLEVPLEQTGGVISEVNTTPGLHWHYLVAPGTPPVPVAESIARRLLDLPAADVCS